MSVTITTETTLTGSYEVRCGCVHMEQGEAQATFANYEEAKAWFSAYREAPYPLPNCEDDLSLAYLPMLSAVTVEKDVPSVNMANGNASGVFDALGIPSTEEGFVGSMSGDDFEGRVLMALAVAPVSAERVYECVGSNWHVAGLPEGYVQSRLEQLRDVAAYARQHGLEVIWS